MNEQNHKQNPSSDAIEIVVAKAEIEDPIARAKLNEIGTSLKSTDWVSKDITSS